MNLFDQYTTPMLENANTDWSKFDLELAVDKNRYNQMDVDKIRSSTERFLERKNIKIPKDMFECFLWNKPFTYGTGRNEKTIRKWFMLNYIDGLDWEISHIVKNYIRDEKMIKMLPVLAIGMTNEGAICCDKDGLVYIFNGKELYPVDDINDAMLESVYYTEADDPPPEVDPPTADDSDMDMSADEVSTDDGSSPPDIGDLSSPDMGSDDGSGEYQDDGSGDGTGGEGGEGGEGEDPNDLPLDEKGEIFAKVEILKSYRYLHKRITDTINTIDKIDIVQIGNQISSDDVAELKHKFITLRDDVYATIVFEFTQQYSNLKVKLIAYSAKYVHLVKSLVSMIKKDQRL